MKVFESTRTFGEKIGPVVLTIGNFDGVHIGHQALLSAVVREAERLSARPAAITFSPHPLKVLLGNPNIKLLTTEQEKEALIERLGIGLLFRLKFDEQMAATRARDFVCNHLHRNLSISALIVGHDYTLGRNREGDVRFLKQIGAQLGFEVVELSPVRMDGLTVSSTKIRECIVNGDISLANRMLGRPYSLRGLVDRCSGRGHSLGFPTANLVSTETVLPQNGVYITQVILGSKTLPAVTNVGHHPTFYSEKTRVETHIIDDRIDLYGKEVSILFLERIRPERRFGSREELIRQICSDVNRARQYFLKGPVERAPARAELSGQEAVRKS